MDSNCWINIECPTEAEKKIFTRRITNPEAFYNDIEDIDERPRIEIENGWTFIMRIPEQRCEIALSYHSCWGCF
jgi:magnesium transporter